MNDKPTLDPIDPVVPYWAHKKNCRCAVHASDQFIQEVVDARREPVKAIDIVDEFLASVSR